MLTVSRTISWRKLQRRVNEAFGFVCRLSFRDEDGDSLVLASTDDLEAAISSVPTGTTLHLTVEKVVQSVPRRVKQWLEWQALPMLVLDSDSIVRFANRAFEEEFQVSLDDLIDQHLDQPASSAAVPSTMSHGQTIKFTFSDRSGAANVSVAPDRSFTVLTIRRDDVDGDADEEIDVRRAE